MQENRESRALFFVFLLFSKALSWKHLEACPIYTTPLAIGVFETFVVSSLLPSKSRVLCVFVLCIITDSYVLFYLRLPPAASSYHRTISNIGRSLVTLTKLHNLWSLPLSFRCLVFCIYTALGILEVFCTSLSSQLGNVALETRQ